MNTELARLVSELKQKGGEIYANSFGVFHKEQKHVNSSPWNGTLYLYGPGDTYESMVRNKKTNVSVTWFHDDFIVIQDLKTGKSALYTYNKKRNILGNIKSVNLKECSLTMETGMALLSHPTAIFLINDEGQVKRIMKSKVDYSKYGIVRNDDGTYTIYNGGQIVMQITKQFKLISKH